jgi:membrane-associated HD superfamily phosphohydrolase
MKYFKVVREKLSQSVKDSKARYSLASFILVIILSTVLLGLDNTDESYDYTIGAIASGDIRVSRDIQYVKEDETRMKRERLTETIPMVFDRDPAVLAERLNLANVLCDNIISTMDQNPPIGNDDMAFQLMTLKTRLPQYLQYNDSLLLSLLFYDNPRDLKRVVLKTIIYIYDNKEIFILEKPYENPLKLSTRNIAVRSLASSVESDEILATTDNLQTVADLRKKIGKICYSIAPNLPRRTLTAVTQLISNTLRSNTVFNEEETKRRIMRTMNEVKPVTGILRRGRPSCANGDHDQHGGLSKIRILKGFPKGPISPMLMGSYFCRFSSFSFSAFSLIAKPQTYS